MEYWKKSLPKTETRTICILKMGQAVMQSTLFFVWLTDIFLIPLTVWYQYVTGEYQIFFQVRNQKRRRSDRTRVVVAAFWFYFAVIRVSVLPNIYRRPFKITYSFKSTKQLHKCFRSFYNVICQQNLRSYTLHNVYSRWKDINTRPLFTVEKHGNIPFVYCALIRKRSDLYDIRPPHLTYT